MMEIFQRLPLSRKILLGIVPLFLLFVSVSVVLQNRFQQEEMMQQARESALTYANIIKESLVSMMVTNLEVDESFLQRVNELRQFDTVHVLVNDLKLREEVVPKEHRDRLATKHRTLLPHDEVEKEVLATGRAAYRLVGDRFRAVVPFTASKVCQECHAVPAGYVLGATDLHISFERITEAAAGNWQRSLVIFVAFAIVAIAAASLMFTRVIARPVDRLVEATTEITKGNLEHTVSTGNGRREPDQSQDELVFLAQKFDEMRMSLKEKIGQLDQVNRSLMDRNREVEEALERLRRAQEQLVQSERLAVTGKMTAQLSHEINNPIHNIQSLLESSLRKINGNSQARELISVALEEVNRMAKLTRQMLDVYRASVVSIERESVDIKDLLSDLVRASEEPLAGRGVEIVLETPSQLPLIQGSRDKLKQVFLNFFANARDAMPNGGTITVTAHSRHGCVVVDVADTGTGIPQQYLGRIFDAFFTTKKEVSGVGLGLAVSHGIVQQHNGTIEVASTVGKGTTFTVKLPIAGETHGTRG